MRLSAFYNVGTQSTPCNATDIEDSPRSQLTRKLKKSKNGVIFYRKIKILLVPFLDPPIIPRRNNCLFRFHFPTTFVFVVLGSYLPIDVVVEVLQN